MSIHWSEEDEALILREVQSPTMSNEELAEQLGRSLKSIAAKKRFTAERLKRQEEAAEEAEQQADAPEEAETEPAPEQHEPEAETEAAPDNIDDTQENPAEEPTEQEQPEAEQPQETQKPDAHFVLREWTPEEDAALQEIPYRSEEELSKMLGRSKSSIHNRRRVLTKQRLAEKERKKRIYLERCTVPLTKQDAADEPQTAEPVRLLPEPAVTIDTIEPPRKTGGSSPSADKLQIMEAAVKLLKGNPEAVEEFIAVAEYILQSE